MSVTQRLTNLNTSMLEELSNEALVLLDREISGGKSESDSFWYAKSLVHANKKQWEEAIECCKNAINLKQKVTKYNFTLAQFYYSSNKLIEAKTTQITYLDNFPHDTKALYFIAQIFKELDDKTALAITLIRISAIEDLSLENRAFLLQTLEQVHIINFSSEVIKGLIKILSNDELGTISLTKTLENYLTIKYELGSTKSIHLNDVIRDELLLKALPRIRFTGKKIEIFLRNIREALFRLTLNTTTLDIRYIELIRGIALSNYENEYVFYVKDEEEKLVQEAEKLLFKSCENPEWTPRKSESILLVLSMYKDFFSLSSKELLLKHQLSLWPNTLYDIAKKNLYDIHREILVSKEIPSLSNIENEVSKEVQSQYEENPYPRWRACITRPIGQLGKFVCSELRIPENSLLETLFTDNFSILIAGSGTGIQPISAAKRFPESKITAIDISRRSLAYAKLKAKENKIQNIDFFHADILNLPDNLGKFDYIECCGVLHHMQDPLLGWKKLLRLLKPRGIMKVALYSAAARKDITTEKNKICELNLKPTTKNIKLYREALLNQNIPSPIVERFADFYCLSECRDLLFHSHEKCYDWDDIQNMTEELNVKFLGIFDNAKIKNWYKKYYKTDTPEYSSFEKLKNFENNNSYAFASMYQFLVQKPA